MLLAAANFRSATRHFTRRLGGFFASVDRSAVRAGLGQLTDQWWWAGRSELRHSCSCCNRKTNIWLRRCRKPFLLFINTLISRNWSVFNFVAASVSIGLISVPTYAEHKVNQASTLVYANCTLRGTLHQMLYSAHTRSMSYDCLPLTAVCLCKV